MVSSDSEQQMVRRCWSIPIDILKLICRSNGLDCECLDSENAAPLEWAACLVDDGRPAEVSGGSSIVGKAGELPAKAGTAGAAEPSMVAAPDAAAGPDTTAVADAEAAATLAAVAPATAAFETKATDANEVTSPQRKPKPKRKPKAVQEEHVQTAAEESARPTPAKPPARTLALPSALVDSWNRLAKRTVTHVAESTGFVHFELGIDATVGKRSISLENYILAFPNRDKSKQRY